MRFAGALVLVTFLLAGCVTSVPLMPTPNLRVGDHATFEAVPPHRQSVDARVVYVTDRRAKMDDKRLEGFTSGRSRLLKFGIATVAIGGEEDGDWADLAADSRRINRKDRRNVDVESLSHRGSFPRTPVAIEWVEGQLTGEPVAVAAQNEASGRLAATIVGEMRPEDGGRVYVYVHGFNNNFDRAVSVMAQFWHFAGRRGVPVVFTWPAAWGGLRGYAADRESGEFAVRHLKLLLRTLAATERVERIDLIAHSRGADVLTTALRELDAEERGGGRKTSETYKLGRLVLAAPDIDLEVFLQRFIAEGLSNDFERVTIYTSSSDRAIRAASFLFGGFTRLGRAGLDAFTPAERASLTAGGNFDVIEVVGRSSRLGHSYFYDDPDVSSDLILNIVDRRDPGTDRRPLEAIEPGFWRLGDDYLIKR